MFYVIVGLLIWGLLVLLYLRLMVPPHFTIGPVGNIYLKRWYVIPRNRFFNIYLHNALRDDDDVGLHDHPWWNVSIILKGGYWEEMPRLGSDLQVGLSRRCEPALLLNWQNDLFADRFQMTKRLWRRPGSILFRRATDAHRLLLRRTGEDARDSIPSWSLFITGPRRRTWGFWLPTGWVPHDQLVRKKTDGGNEFDPNALDRQRAQ